MKTKVLTIVLCFAAVSLRSQELTLNEAKEIATTYYGSFQQMAQHPVGEIQVQSELRIMNIVGKDVNGVSLANDFRVPNDLVEVGDNIVDKETLTITNYIGSFVKIAEEKQMDFSYLVLSKEYLSGAEMKKNEDVPDFVKVVVRKTINTPGHFALQIHDTMCLNTRNKNLSSIKNNYRQSGLHDEGVTIEELFAEAHSKYSNKQYEEAFRLYQRVVEMDPEHDGAWYCLGVMYYWEEGVGKLSWKQRQNLAYEHLHKAYEYVDKSDTKKVNKISHAITVVTHGRKNK